MAELLPPGAPLVEGAHSAQIAAELARRHNVETPIIDVVAAIIGGRLTVADAVAKLLARPLRQETD